MRTAFVLLAAAVLAAGCTASGGDDPWAYMKRPLYASGFQLDRIAGGEDTHQFRVTDGSITNIRLQVWVNATEGGATVTISDPSERVMLQTSETTEHITKLGLGQWRVKVEVPSGSAGTVHVLVTRA